MWETLKNLVASLPEGDLDKYASRRDARKVLQQVKVEAQALRVKLAGMAKK